MQLTDEQKQKVAAWVQEGAALAEIQRRLAAEFSLSLTYMDVRFLIIDLGLQVKERPSKAPASPMPPAKAEADVLESELDAEYPEPSAVGGVKVELDRITKPGSVVSGSVTFSDGVTGAWSLDQFGRLALNASRPGYQPAPQDVQAFQLELRRALERRGF